MTPNVQRIVAHLHAANTLARTALDEACKVFDGLVPQPVLDEIDLAARALRTAALFVDPGCMPLWVTVDSSQARAGQGAVRAKPPEPLWRDQATKTGEGSCSGCGEPTRFGNVLTGVHLCASCVPSGVVWRRLDTIPLPAPRNVSEGSCAIS